MNQTDIVVALAAQEEHIRRSRSCGEVVGKSHAFRAHGNPLTKAAFSACVVCGVTETAADWAIQIGAVSS